MPVKLDQQQSIISEVFNEVKINKTVNDNDNLILTIFYTRYLNGTEVSRNNQHVVSGQDFIDLVMVAPTEATRYMDTKMALYGKLMGDLGLTGTVS